MKVYNQDIYFKDTHSLALETQLSNHYIIKSILGHGGSGWVYLAHHRLLDEYFAIKELFPMTCCYRTANEKNIQLYSTNAKEQFDDYKKHILNEAEILIRIRHPNILHIYDFFEENNTVYLVMEYLKGYTLKDYIKMKGSILTEKDIRKITLNILYALDYIHNKTIIHKDICTENIFCEESGTIKLIDFGCADSYLNKKDFSIIIRKGYSPPEQYKNKKNLGPWTDLYALGAVMYKAVTGQNPPDSLERKNNDSLMPPNCINKKISLTLNTIILKALSINYQARYQTAQDFIKDLENFEFCKKTYMSSKKIFLAITLLSVIIIMCCAILIFINL